MFAVVTLSFLAGFLALWWLLIVAIIAKIRKHTAPKRRYIALAFAATIGGLIAIFVTPVSSSITNADVARPRWQDKLPDYLVLRAGQRAYLDSNGEGKDTTGTLFRDWATVEKWFGGNFETPAQLAHVDVPVGTEVTVDSWRTIGSGDLVKRMIMVHAAHPPVRSGYSPDILLLPIPPRGRIVIVSGLAQPQKGKPDKGVPMYQTRNAPVNDYIYVRTLSKATLLDVDQHPDTDSPYRVRIIDGPQRGQSGYFARYAVSAPSRGAGGREYGAWCKCVSLYLNTGDDK